MIRKVKGRAFHLPLLLQETLVKVCLSEDPKFESRVAHSRLISKKSKVVWVGKFWWILIKYINNKVY